MLQGNLSDKVYEGCISKIMTDILSFQMKEHSEFEGSIVQSEGKSESRSSSKIEFKLESSDKSNDRSEGQSCEKNVTPISIVDSASVEPPVKKYRVGERTTWATEVTGPGLKEEMKTSPTTQPELSCDF